MTTEEEYKKIKKLKIKAAKGNKLTFAEKNIIKMYDKKFAKQTLN